MLQILTSQCEDSEERIVAIYDSFIGRLLRRRCAEGTIRLVDESGIWYASMEILSSRNRFSLTAGSYIEALQLSAGFVSQCVELSSSAPAQHKRDKDAHQDPRENLPGRDPAA